MPMPETNPPLGAGWFRFRYFSADESTHDDTSAILYDEDSRDTPSTGPGVAADTTVGRVLVTSLAGGLPVKVGWMEVDVPADPEDPVVYNELEEILPANGEKNFPKVTVPGSGTYTYQTNISVFRAI